MYQTKRFSTNEERWMGLVERNPEAEGHFFYCVRTTMICCRPTCSSRLAFRENITFFSTLSEAINAGYRTCKRCRPDDKDWNTQRKAVTEACRFLAEHAKKGKAWMSVDVLAKNAGLSKWHFLRVFKRYTKTTPRSYFLQLASYDTFESKELPIIVTKKSLQIKPSNSLIQESDGTFEYLGNNDTSEALILTGEPINDSSVFQFEGFQNLPPSYETDPLQNIPERRVIPESLYMCDYDPSLTSMNNFYCFLQDLFPELEVNI